MNHLDELGKLDLPKDKYAIFGSGPMAVRGIRESDDIDIIVKSEVWAELANKYAPTRVGESEFYHIEIGNIEIFNNWGKWFDNVNELIDDSETIEEHPYVKLKYVIKWKKAFGREKDLKDIKLIEEFQQNN